MSRVGQSLARLRSFGRAVAGQSGTAVIAVLAKHVATDIEGVRLAQRIIDHEISTTVAEEEMLRIEHEGDELRRNLVEELARLIVTPLDREDLFRLSRSIDDILDNIRDFTSEWVLYQPVERRRLFEVLETIAKGLDELHLAIRALPGDLDRVVRHLLAAKHVAGGVRRHFETEVAELFNGELSVEVLKHRELLRRLDIVGLRFGEAVDVLFDALVKRGGGLAPP